MVTLTVLLLAKTMSRGFVGCIISWNVSFLSTMSSPKMVTAATQTPWPCTVVYGITTSLASSMKSTAPEINITGKGIYDTEKTSKRCYSNLLISLIQYRQKYWWSLNSPVWPQTDCTQILAEFKFVHLSGSVVISRLRYLITKPCVREIKLAVS